MERYVIDAGGPVCGGISAVLMATVGWKQGKGKKSMYVAGTRWMGYGEVDNKCGDDEGKKRERGRDEKANGACVEDVAGNVVRSWWLAGTKRWREATVRPEEHGRHVQRAWCVGRSASPARPLHPEASAGRFLSAVDGPAEVTPCPYGYFSQRSGFLIYMGRPHLTRVQSPGSDPVYWDQLSEAASTTTATSTASPWPIGENDGYVYSDLGDGLWSREG
ncbi:hypothetical protein HPP92_028342 [Vanilla planifolia]|uniref:Uncharacterized protein n=1 Tax=Vanilla planifolia TaxID=51239 RepID=A0A835PBA7_VANPL|nr:hypothetical protein HPP92_028342 [Vanilla planifolia]KAG0447472.1 hypothetical protein HPP92_028326 [Vanilla planifolia]